VFNTYQIRFALVKVFLCFDEETEDLLNICLDPADS